MRCLTFSDRLRQLRESSAPASRVTGRQVVQARRKTAGGAGARPKIPARRKNGARRGRVVDETFIAWAKETYPCEIAGRNGHLCDGVKTFHHVREYGSPKNDRRGLVLCAAGHLKGFGPDAIHELGKDRWQERFAFDIEESIRRKSEAYEARVDAVLRGATPENRCEGARL